MPADSPTPVLIDNFVHAMTRHWRDHLGNSASPALQGTWRVMAETFAAAISAEAIGERKWRVLNPPTGTGKTEGLKVYCSLLAQAQANRFPGDNAGVLLVTRQIKQAEGLANSINSMSGSNAAIAWHSQSSTSAAQAAEHDILAVTHSAFVRALGDHTNGPRGWEELNAHPSGRRSLVVIDEALDDIVRQYQVTAEDIRWLLGHIPEAIRVEHEGPVHALSDMQDVFLESQAMVIDHGQPVPAFIFWREVAEGRIEFPEAFKMDGLLESLRTHLRADGSRRRRPSQETELTLGRLAHVLSSCQAIFELWGWYAQRGKEHTFNSARLLIPFEAANPVVLDATATQNMLWELLEDRVEPARLPSGVRSYGNGTLYADRVRRTGKAATLEEARERFPRILGQLERQLPSDTRVFACVPKDAEHVAIGLNPDFDLDVAHWGDLDGKNGWHDHEAALILSLPFRDDVWSTNMFCAPQGLPKGDQVNSLSWGDYEDVRRVMQSRQIAVSLIQAVNRVRCRHVIDEAGNCAPTSIYVLLPTGAVGDELPEALRAEMPGLKVMDWESGIGDASRGVRKGSSHEALLTLMHNKKPDEYAWSGIAKELDLKGETAKALRRVLNQDEHPTTKELRRLGVTYFPGGKGPGDKSRLIKVDLETTPATLS